MHQYSLLPDPVAVIGVHFEVEHRLLARRSADHAESVHARKPYASSHHGKSHRSSKYPARITASSNGSDGFAGALAPTFRTAQSPILGKSR